MGISARWSRRYTNGINNGAMEEVAAPTVFIVQPLVERGRLGRPLFHFLGLPGTRLL
jgi:hypothetical protein